MQKRNVLNSPRLSEFKKKKRKIFIRKVLYYILVFIIIIFSLSCLSKINRLNIGQIKIEGNRVIENKQIEEIIYKETLGSYFWLFPKTNIFLYPKNKIKIELNNKFKRLQNIALSIKNIQIEAGAQSALLISVSERSGEYTWCGVLPENKNSGEDCYFLDRHGYVFDKAPYFSGEVYFKFYSKINSENNNPIGYSVAEGYFDKLVSFKETLADMGLKPAALYIEEGDDVKIYLSREKILETSPVIIFKKNSDFKKIAENLKAALDVEPLLSRFKKSYSTLKYIDLRFGNKVYYKF